MPDRAWYYASSGQQRGPVKTAQLKQLATSGELKPDDLVWCDGMPNWSAASTVKGLFPADAARPVDLSAAPTAETLPHEGAGAPRNPPAADHQYREQLQSAREFATQASREAAGAFKTLMADPIGGLAPCFAKLGNKRAMQVGIIFLIAAVALYALAALMSFGALLPGVSVGITGAEKAKFFVKSLIAAVVAVAAMVGVSYAFRSMISRSASFHADLFVVGAASMPYALATFLTSLLRTSVAIVAMAILVFGAVFSLLILFNAQTTIARLSERTGALAVASIAAAGAIAQGLVMLLLS